MTPPDAALTLPSPPAAERPRSFPLLATVAPVALSLCLWLVTGSLLSLLFAVLGPVIGLAALGDARLSARRHARRERRRFAADVEACRREISSRVDVLRRRAELEAPPVWATGHAAAGGAWDRAPGQEVRIGVGWGELPSGLAVRPEPGRDEAEELLALRSAASVMPLARVALDARAGIAVTGPAPLAAALGRSLLVQLARAVGPPAAFDVPIDAEDWLEALPHPVRRSQRADHELVLPEGGRVRVLVEPTAGGELTAARPRLRPRHRVLLAFTAEGLMAAGIPGHPDGLHVDPELVTRAEAARVARLLAEAAGPSSAGLPETLSLAELLEERGQGGDPAAAAPELAAIVGSTGEEPLELDLAQGPHALVGGGTGSGKSRFLVTWLLSMAFSSPPDRLNLLLVDFKGGAAFAPLVALPHTVGLVTDLDEQSAQRALLSLAAELRRRERLLAEVGAASVDGAPALPRLVVVIDEFAALLARHPALEPLLTDVAARGRSLGVHLVLATQHPATAVRDALRANLGITVSLRPARGPDGARDPELDRPGVAIVHSPGAPERVAMIAVSDDDDVRRIAARHRPVRVHRPWLPPLPARVARADLPAAAGVRLGIADRPETQEQPVAVWRPATEGNLAVFGASGSGKTTALRALAADWEGDVMFPLADPAAVWDAVTAAAQRLDDGGPEQGPPALLLLDDLDAVLELCPEEFARELQDRVVRLMRRGPGAGLFTVVAAQRLTSAITPAVGLTAPRLLLRLASRQDHALLGGSGDTHRADLPPGAGLLDGVRVQVALPDGSDGPERSGPLVRELRPGEAVAAVTGRPSVLAGRLEAAGMPVREIAAERRDLTVTAPADPVLLLGGPDDWQGRWQALASLQRTGAVLFHECSLADLRALLRERAWPPPAPAAGYGSGGGWLRLPSGRLERVRLPPASPVDPHPAEREGRVPAESEGCELNDGAFREHRVSE